MMTSCPELSSDRGEKRADSAAADDDHFHAWISPGIGSRTTHTAHGAFLRT